MASYIFKGLAVAAGLGLVIGLGSGNRLTGERSTGTRLPGDHPATEPLADRLEERLDRLEARIILVEDRPAMAAEGASSTELDLLTLRHAKEIDSLRSQLAAEMPAVLESIVAPRVEALRTDLRIELQQTMGVTLTRFERAINDQVSDRIAGVERALRDQSNVVNGLSRRSVESDANVKRLVMAVERLSERSTPDPAPPPAFESGFRPQIVKDDEDVPRNRRQMAAL